MRIRKESTRQRIIGAARQLFLDRGYAATSMEAIADMAGTTKQTLYGYFADKRTLFMSVMEDVMGGTWELDLSLDTLHNLDDLRAVLFKIGVYINSIIAEPDYIQLIRVVIVETMSDPGLSKLLERGVTVRVLRSLTTLFGAAKKKGIIVIEQPGVPAQFFIGGFVTRLYLQGLLMQSGKGYIRKQTKAELSRYVDNFMKLVA